MSLNLSDEELQKIADQLFLLKTPKPTPLQKPTTSTDANSLSAKLDPIGSDARFKDLGIGVVDFTHDRMAPAVWIYNGDTPWRIGSTAKICILLAAVQLRDDVRKVKNTGLISSPAEYDELFGIIWRRSLNSKIKQIAKVGSAPRISTILDVSKTPLDFIGADIPLDRNGIITRLGSDNELAWDEAPDFSFWERLWLTGAHSDNVAASTCISEIGVAYMKEVLRTYQLFYPSHGLHLLLGGGYANIKSHTPVNRNPGAFSYRTLQNLETTAVLDKYKNSHQSSQAGSAVALTAYMMALMQDKIVDKAGCDTIRTLLADETNETTASLILDGVEEVERVTKAHTKLGILGSLRCEFAYLETGPLNYAVLTTGILPKKVGSARFDEEQQGRDLGKAIHKALLAA